MTKDPLFVNKLLGAVLLAGVLATGTGFVANLLYKTDSIVEDSYPIAAAEGDAETTEPAPVDILMWAEVSLAMATADLAKGEKLFKKCTSCHTIAADAPNKVGPNLWNIIERQVASVDGFAYSKTLKGMTEQRWTFEDLNGFITKPKKYAPGTKMIYYGMKKPADRAALLLYLASKSGQ